MTSVSERRPFVAIVEDEEPTRKALMRPLRSADMDMVSFASGAEFLQSLTTRRPALARRS